MGYRSQSEDTAPAPEQIQFEIYGRMTAADKMERIRALCRQANQLALAGLRRRYTGEGDEALRHRLAVMRLGEALAKRLCHGRDG